MGCTWLKSKREQARLTQDTLATELGEYPEAVRRWENCHKKAKKQVPYASLAKALDVSEIVLCEDHARDLQVLGRAEDAERARNAAHQLRLRENFRPIDPAPIQAQLEACKGNLLSAKLAKNKPDFQDEAGQASHIAELIGQNNWDDLTDWINDALESAIDEADTADQLGALKQWLIVIAQRCAARDQDLKPGCWQQPRGEKKAWTIRAMIDHSTGRNGMRLVKLDPNEPSYSLDDSPDSTRAVRSGPVTVLDVEGRVHELVSEFSEVRSP